MRRILSLCHFQSKGFSPESELLGQNFRLTCNLTNLGCSKEMIINFVHFTYFHLLFRPFDVRFISIVHRPTIARRLVVDTLNCFLIIAKIINNIAKRPITELGSQWLTRSSSLEQFHLNYIQNPIVELCQSRFLGSTPATIILPAKFTGFKFSSRSSLWIANLKFLPIGDRGFHRILLESFQ